MRLAWVGQDSDPVYLLLAEGLLWSVLSSLLIFLLIMLVVLRVGQVEIVLALGDHVRLAEEQAADALVDVELLAEVLCDVSLEHKLVVLLSKVLQHGLVGASVDLRQFSYLLSLGLLRNRLVKIHFV